MLPGSLSSHPPASSRHCGGSAAGPLHSTFSGPDFGGPDGLLLGSLSFPMLSSTRHGAADPQHSQRLQHLEQPFGGLSSGGHHACGIDGGLHGSLGFPASTPAECGRATPEPLHMRPGSAMLDACSWLLPGSPDLAAPAANAPAQRLAALI